MNPNPVTPPRRTARTRGRAAAVLACVLLLTGCGVRLDSPPPTEPVPGPVEIVRRTAVDDALHVAEQAEAVAAQKGTKSQVAELLLNIADISRQHAGQLGGEYRSGLETDPPSPAPSETAIPPEASEVLTTLTDAAARSATAADVCEDGPLARLLSSVSAAQTLAARRLAGATGAEKPASPAPVIPGAGDAVTAMGTDEPEDGEEAVDGTEETDTTTAALTPSDRPTTPPGGLSEEDFLAVVLAEDSTAYAFEVRAAQADDEAVAERLADRALTHRRRAEAWARLAGIDGTEKDPRRAAYELPDPAVRSKDVFLEAEDRIAANYANLTGLADAGTRSSAVALLTDSAIARSSWGAPLTPFPGLPEQAGS